ncbi:hypothetical protein JCM19000A_07830 [Silvimonas sp. JCM 19000]
MLIEDDSALRDHLQQHLQRRGFAVRTAARGDDGLALALQIPLDLVLLDIMLPGANGLAVLQQLRGQRGTPVMLMSALGAEQDRISGFSQGADDYLPKPFSLAELDARIDALLRRVALDRRASVAAPGVAPEPSAAFRFDTTAQDVLCHGRAAGLTGSEFRLLLTLHEHLGEALSKAFLYQRVLHRGYTRLDRGLDVHVCNVRRKLAAISADHMQIQAVRGQGYVLTVQAAA